MSDDRFLPGFEPKPLYPVVAGFTAHGTSQEQAAKVEPKAKILREKIVLALSRRSMTADECAAVLGEDVLSIRPRFSELARAIPPRIVKTGERRLSSRRNPSDVWAVT